MVVKQMDRGGARPPARLYHIMGIVGVGKTTLLHTIAPCGPHVYPEWIEPMPPDLLSEPSSLSAVRRKMLQNWIFMQVARKNALLREERTAYPGEVIISDRSPLDTFAFYKPEQWQKRALELLKKLSLQNPPLRLTPAALIFLECNVLKVYRRIKGRTGYEVKQLQKQNLAFHQLFRWLREQDIPTTTISVTKLDPEAVGSAVMGEILDEPYQEVNIQALVEHIARGAYPLS